MSDYMVLSTSSRTIAPGQLLGDLRGRGIEVEWRPYEAGSEQTRGYLVAPGDPAGGGEVAVSASELLDLERRELDGAFGPELPAEDRARLAAAGAVYRVTASAGATLDARRVAAAVAALIAGATGGPVLDEASEAMHTADAFRARLEEGLP